MPIPLAVRVFGKPYAEVDRLLGKPRAVGAGHRFHEYSRTGGGYYIVFDEGRSVIVTVTLRQPPPSAVQTLAMIGFQVAGKKPVLQTPVEMRWENLSGIPVVIVRATGGKRWDTVELRRR